VTAELTFARGRFFSPEAVPALLSRFAPKSRFVLTYDSSCGPCTTFKRLVSFLDPRGGIDYLSLEEADSQGLLDPLPRRSRYASAHLVLPNGEVLSGARAIPKLLELLPGGFVTSRMAGGWELGRRLVIFAYDAAVHRHDAGTCKKGSPGSHVAS
jgi:predicted DCC family thiol-disulfide oxidoreductase YuxK